MLCGKTWVGTIQLAYYVNGLGLEQVLSAEREAAIMLHMHDPVSCNTYTTISIAISICLLTMFTLHACKNSRSARYKSKPDM